MAKPQRQIFVFGSNLKGIHGKGAALTAKREHGAINGQGQGLQGNSYAIPTKRGPYEYLTLTEIQTHVEEFIHFARNHPDLLFNVTALGTGYAEHKVQGIAPMFKDVSDNVRLPEAFLYYLNGCLPEAGAWDTNYQARIG